MRPTRREFLRWAGGVSAVGLAGCDAAVRLGLAPPEMDGGPWTAPEAERIDAVSHVLNRLGYGARPGDYARATALGVEAWIEEQLAPESLDDRAAEYRVRRLEALAAPVGELYEYKEEYLLRELCRGSVLRAVYSRRQLHEVMVEFWSDHFNIDRSKGECRWLKAADDRDVIREHALGRFPELLRASALSPAMLWYLDGRVNRRTRGDEMPNENYARELMELHTLGVDGGYTQHDVMEAARCLTGWTVRDIDSWGKGRVEFRAAEHDNGEKTVLGRRIPAGGGPADLDALLDIVAHHPSTARFIAGKLCRTFMCDAPPDDAIRAVAETFANTSGDIRATLRTLFRQDAFWQSAGVRIKRPFRFVVSALRATGAETDGGGAVLDYLQRMGHAPFQYPTPDGYPMEPAPWMGTLFWRWEFAAALAGNRLAGVRVDWAGLSRRFGDRLVAHFLSRQPTPLEQEAIVRAEGPGLVFASPAFQRF